MTNIKPIEIKMVIRAGRYHGETMGITIRQNGEVVSSYEANHFPDEKIHIQFLCSLPLDLEFIVDGKNLNDTWMDEHGNLLEDKCMVVEQMCVDNIWLKKWYLESQAFNFCDHHGDCRSTNYFGYNGRAVFQIATPDLLEFWLETMCV